MPKKNQPLQSWERFLIMSDLDGTLLNNESDVSPLTVRTIKKLVASGHIFVIITGRPPQNSVHIYRKLGLKHLMCNLNGAYIWNPSDNDFIPVNLCFSANIVVRILSSKLVMKYVDNFVIENYNGTYIRYKPKLSEEAAEFSSFHIRPGQTVVEVGDNVSILKEADCHSVLVQVKDNDKDNLNKLIFELRLFSPTLVTRVWKDEYLGYMVEVTTKFANKGTALDYLSNYYSIPRENCIAFGDADNDCEMLQTATYGYAMMNGTAAAKLAASYITKYTNDKDGVAKVIVYIERLIHRTINTAKKRIIEEYEKTIKHK